MKVSTNLTRTLAAVLVGILSLAISASSQSTLEAGSEEIESASAPFVLGDAFMHLTPNPDEDLAVLAMDFDEHGMGVAVVQNNLDESVVIDDFVVLAVKPDGKLFA